MVLQSDMTKHTHTQGFTVSLAPCQVLEEEVL